MTASTPAPPRADVDALDGYLRLLAGRAPGARLMEIRFALHRGDMGRVFVAAHGAAGAGRLIRRLAARTDVYVGVCLRTRRSGGRDAIDRSHLAFVEIDTADALQRLRGFAFAPTMIVSSGSPGHAHAYFALSEPVTVSELERVNRQLARALGGDLACTDASRILRAPATWNHKTSPPAPVELIDLDPARRYDPDQITGGREDPRDRPSARPTRGSPRAGRTELDRLLLAVPAAEYVEALTGRSPDRVGKVQCPFHQDTRPSLQLYPDGSWCCFGSHGNEGRIGGTIYDFAGRLWHISTKGRGFLELRQRLIDEVLQAWP